VAIRAPASLGVADVIAVRAGEIRLVEVKSTSAPSPFASFGPAARSALQDAAEIAGGSAWLVHWPPRKPPRWIPSDEWP
jgi:Holliday junction resolvase